MTPRALVTAIVTTAFGFALIIGSVAGSTSATGGQASAAFGNMHHHAMHMQLAADEDAPSQCVAWNDPCENAL